MIPTAFVPYRATVQGIAVESTYNWYWLVDGLMGRGYRVHLAMRLPCRSTAGSSTPTISMMSGGWRTGFAWARFPPAPFIPKPNGQCKISSESGVSVCATKPWWC
ncbi:MAG: hypothetical protein ABI604_14875 [Nitrospirota bacterium]